MKKKKIHQEECYISIFQFASEIHLRNDMIGEKNHPESMKYFDN
jgi:hypothetical protein